MVEVEVLEGNSVDCFQECHMEGELHVLQHMGHWLLQAEGNESFFFLSFFCSIQ